jgi:hypothetical protein
MDMHIHRHIPLLPDLVEKRGCILYCMMAGYGHTGSGAVYYVCTGRKKKTVMVPDTRELMAVLRLIAG